MIKVFFLLSCLLFSFFALCDAPVKNQTRSSPMLGVYVGSGRACAGKLVLSDKQLSWITPFSQCESQLYQEVDLQESADMRTSVLKIAKPTHKCLYEYVVIENKLKKDVIQVTGYKTLADQRAHRLDEALSCAVVFED